LLATRAPSRSAVIAPMAKNAWRYRMVSPSAMKAAPRHAAKEATMSKGQQTPPKTNKPKLSTKEKQAKKKEKAGKK
jgi:hypothetical protein